MRIYIIDEEFIVTKTLQGFLNDLGHEVVSCNSLAEFLGYHNGDNGSADVIIVDLKMPKENAIRIVSEIHRRYPDSEIVVMSSILPFKEAISNNVYSYLKKPVHLDELELILARMSERHEGMDMNIPKITNRINFKM